MFNWWKWRRTQGLLAASLYDDLTAEERRELDTLLGASGSLRKEAESLRNLVQSVPSERPACPVDLTDRLRRRLNVESTPSRGRKGVPARTVLGAATAVAAVILCCSYVYRLYGVPTDFGNPAAAANAKPNTGLMEKVLAKASQLTASHQDAQAYELLKAGLTERPRDPLASVAELRFADLAFSLGRYPEALEATNKLLAEPYSKIFERQPVDKSRIVRRRDLLAEAERDNFRPLYDLDSACHDRGNELPRLEQVIVSNQGKLVADLAAETMGKVLLKETPSNGDATTAYLDAMKTARQRCSNPYAVALLDLKIGDIYRDRFDDYPSAEEHYRMASENPVLAHRAQDALETLTADLR